MPTRPDTSTRPVNAYEPCIRGHLGVFPAQAQVLVADHPYCTRHGSERLAEILTKVIEEYIG